MKPTPRTYWHLADLGRRPNDYDVGSSRLLFYPERGLSTGAAIRPWLRRYQLASPLQLRDWDAFRDPRETTYASYVQLQRTQEAFVDGVLDAADDRRLDPAWLARLGTILPVLRFPCHGLQMVASYLGTLAPGGRVAIACAFHAADELRRVQRLAYRMRQLQHVDASFGAAARDHWETAPAWQPLRELIERLLVAYDLGEALIALHVAVLPRFDELFVVELAALARRHGDDALANMLHSLGEDCRWHRAYGGALVQLAADERPENRAAIATWRERWDPLAARAVTAAAALFEVAP